MDEAAGAAKRTHSPEKETMLLSETLEADGIKKQLESLKMLPLLDSLLKLKCFLCYSRNVVSILQKQF